ncbi:MAG: hypothetical protein IS860_11440 [Nitrosopumilus sp.]|nr:hypothetical protein [Nitrosopumilus sp.]
MIRVRDKLISLYDELGVNHDLESLDNRKQLQKLTYLIEVFGVDLNFRFHWYIHGPYDRKLTAVLYDDSEETSGREVREVFPNEKNNLTKLKEFLGSDIHSSRNLELIVSLHYIMHVGEKDNLTEDAKIIRQLIDLKPQFNESEAKYYLNKIKEFSL